MPQNTPTGSRITFPTRKTHSGKNISSILGPPHPPGDGGDDDVDDDGGGTIPANPTSQPTWAGIKYPIRVTLTPIYIFIVYDVL